MCHGKTLCNAWHRSSESIFHENMSCRVQRNGPKISGDKPTGWAQSAPLLLYDWKQGPISLSLLEPKNFSKTNFFFQNISNFSHALPLLSGIYFWRAWNWTQVFKNNLKNCNTGCPVNWYSLSISIPDFSDCPIKKNLICKIPKID